MKLPIRCSPEILSVFRRSLLPEIPAEGSGFHENQSANLYPKLFVDLYNASLERDMDICDDYIAMPLRKFKDEERKLISQHVKNLSKIIS